MGKSYVISDIHGQYDMLVDVLKKIQLKDTDKLYILGDVLDRGPHPIKTMEKLMKMPNCIFISGNHELMALECLTFLAKDIADISLDELDDAMVDSLVTWQYNGSKTTIEEFRALDKDSRQKIIDFIKEASIYEEIFVEQKKYLLAHTFGNFSPQKSMEDYSLRDFMWVCADYDTTYFNDIYVVTGHTPTQMIKGNLNPGYIYRHNNHIAIDCGAHYPGGRLAAICLDTGEEFYSYEEKE